MIDMLLHKNSTQNITTNFDAVKLNKLEKARFGEVTNKARSRPKGKKVPTGVLYTNDQISAKSDASEVDGPGKVGDGLGKAGDGFGEADDELCQAGNELKTRKTAYVVLCAACILQMRRKILDKCYDQQTL